MRSKSRWQARPPAAADVRDAELTIDAMCETFGDHERKATIEDMWRRRGAMVRAIMEEAR